MPSSILEMPQHSPINSQEILQTVEKLLSPRSLSYVERIVLLNSWQGKLYREMARETDYEEGYLKDVGSRLWLDLSKQTGQEVTKKNLQSVLTGLCHTENTAGSSISLIPGIQPELAPCFSKNLDQIVFPGSPLPFRSNLYIPRTPIEELAFATLQQAGSLVRIKAPHRMGKTSLINHLLGMAQQSGMRTVFVDMRQADETALENLDQFLRWFCWAIGQQLNLDPKFDEYWFEGAGSKLSCTTYVQEYLLKQSSSPIVVAVDTAHYLVDRPQVAQHFFAMLRSWYEQGRVRDDWQKLRLIIAHVGELELSLPAHQSPFNIGLPLNLPQFTAAQINSLAERYDVLRKLKIRDFDQVQLLLHLIGGQPYLLQLAFYWLRSGLPIARLLEEAPTIRGIYREHLRRLWEALHRDQALTAALQQVLTATEPVPLNLRTACRLEDLGLVQLAGDQARLQCDLYRQYFGAYLDREQG